LEWGADTHVKDNDYGLTPLHWAVFNGDIDCIRSLLEAKSVVDAKAFKGWAPLHYAFRVKGREQAIIRMLNDHGADLNLADNNKQAPLHYSVKSGSIDGARCLLDLGADLEIRDNQRFTPFAKAAQQNEAGLVQLFLSRGTKVDGLTKDGQSTLHLAALYAGVDIMRLMINMDHGGLQSDARDGMGDTPSDCFRKQRDQVFIGLRDSHGRAGCF
jgi:ankyrin repeat protein